ncbi:MAG: bifunctional 5,10-methylenetetrahydrofolate dehydrogenase/5,10-methenyltetrahydrofolate cyclohydrolase [Candidatus Hydrogenedentota bacterium]|nr:MAG: bifunctional 5,10-methylenetetrahydrofolate dehydrogenase/5,10-methenyltetrahydrofolate cyclohydrolase [Candidatus Hydrogenedentota bacterium]
MLNIPKFPINNSLWVEGKFLWGKKLAKEIRNLLKEKVATLQQKPGLAVLLVGDDTASEVYVKSKEKAALECGFHSIVRRLPENASEKDVLNRIYAWNDDPNIHGILVQLPLPKHLPEQKILQSILPEKDVDGFHFVNMGKLFAGEEGIIPCTPLGIAVMLSLLPEDWTGKKAVVLGRSNIVGKPMAQILISAFNMTVTTCHSKTIHLEEEISRSDLVVSAMGKREVVLPEMLKDNSTIIDVGIHRVEGKLCGDLDYKAMEDKVHYITPVPGGVGPMTIAMLLYNTFVNAGGKL